MNEQIQLILDLIKAKPYVIKMGAGFISKWQKCSIENIKKAKKIYYDSINVKSNIKKGPKILLLDIETSPMRAYVWRRWKQNIYLEQTISEWFMLCWSAKWLEEDTIYGERLTQEDVLNENDSSILTSLWKLLDEADIVIGHNSKKFDIPKINSRFLVNNLFPPSPYKQIDTKEVSVKQFGFSSNKLDALATYFNYEKKLDTDFDLWKRCMDGDEEALEYMLVYNKKDVLILEKIYLKLRPYIKGHPNVGIYYLDNDKKCGHCGSTNLKLNGYTYTNISKFKTFRCNDCGSISRSRLNENKNKINLTTIN